MISRSWCPLHGFNLLISLLTLCFAIGRIAVTTVEPAGKALFLLFKVSCRRDLGLNTKENGP